ncbi:MAG: 1,4-alpha-glucan branching protein domain-containing protein [Elusimicrobiota bacterium]
MATDGGTFVLVLHTHLPYVLRHGRWPHGSEWLSQATARCYLPLLAALQRLQRDRVPVKITVNVSPILAEQWVDPEFGGEVVRYLEAQHRAASEDLAEFTREGRSAEARLAQWWLRRFEELQEQWRIIKGDLAGAFRDRRDAGQIEIITCAATHAYLPLLTCSDSIRLQLAQAMRSHERIFGSRPKGIWLPECAYRPGLERYLEEAGFGFFFGDMSLLSGPSFSFSSWQMMGGAQVHLPSRPERRDEFLSRPFEPCWVGPSRRVAVFLRDPKASQQVWSREGGYPGDQWYLEFHKKRSPGGIEYWRVTDPKADLAVKELYEPERAASQAADHARHFAGIMAADLAARAGSVCCAPYDTELFGHWWSEGPLWIEHLFREFARRGVALATASEALEGRSAAEAVTLAEGSWGDGGDHRVWRNGDTEWMWDHLKNSERAAFDALSHLGPDPLGERLGAQILRELVLLQSSDWPFLVTTRSARDYAERRFIVHRESLDKLVMMAQALGVSGASLSRQEQRQLEVMEKTDRVFDDIGLAWRSLRDRKGSRK